MLFSPAVVTTATTHRPYGACLGTVALGVGTGHIRERAERGRSGSEGGGLAAPLGPGSPTLLSHSVCPASLSGGGQCWVPSGLALTRPGLSCLACEAEMVTVPKSGLRREWGARAVRIGCSPVPRALEAASPPGGVGRGLFLEVLRHCLRR